MVELGTGLKATSRIVDKIEKGSSSMKCSIGAASLTPPKIIEDKNTNGAEKESNASSSSTPIWMPPPPSVPGITVTSG